MMTRLLRLEVALLTLAGVLAVGIAVLLVRLDATPRPVAEVVLPITTPVVAVPSVGLPVPTVVPLPVPAGVMPGPRWDLRPWLPLLGIGSGLLLLLGGLWWGRVPLRRLARQGWQTVHAKAGRRALPRLPRRSGSGVWQSLRQGGVRLRRSGTGVRLRLQQLTTVARPRLVIPGQWIRRPLRPGPVVIAPVGSGRGLRLADALAAWPMPLDDEADSGAAVAVRNADRAADGPLAGMDLLAAPPETDSPAVAVGTDRREDLIDEVPAWTTPALRDAAPLPDLRHAVVPAAAPVITALDRAQQAAALLATGWATHGIDRSVLRLSADARRDSVTVQFAEHPDADPALATWLSTVGGSWVDSTTLRLPVAEVALGWVQPPLLPITSERTLTHFWPLATTGAVGVYGAEAVPLALTILASLLMQAGPDALALQLVDPLGLVSRVVGDVPHRLTAVAAADVLALLPTALRMPLPTPGRPLLVVLVAPDGATLQALLPVYRRMRRLAQPGVALLLVCPTLDAAGRELYPLMPALITGAASGDPAWLPGHAWTPAGRVRAWQPPQDWTGPLTLLPDAQLHATFDAVRGGPPSGVPTVFDGVVGAVQATDGLVTSDAADVAERALTAPPLHEAAAAVVDHSLLAGGGQAADDPAQPPTSLIWPAGAGLDPPDLAALLVAALADSAVEVSRASLNALLTAQGVTMNQGVISKQLMTWLVRAAVVQRVPRAPARWTTTDLRVIAQRLMATHADEGERREGAG